MLYYICKESDSMREQICTRIQKAMEAKGLKAADVCQVTGIPKSSMSLYLSGRVKPKSDRVYHLAKCLDVNDAWLLGYDVSMERPEDQKNGDALVDICERLQVDSKFFEIVKTIYALDEGKLDSLLQLLQ